MKKKYVTLTTPPQTGTFTMPADFAANRRLIYYCEKTNKQYDIENLIAENLELKGELQKELSEEISRLYEAAGEQGYDLDDDYEKIYESILNGMERK